MGLMQGKIMDEAIMVTDTFALPVEGTETRVDAHAEGYEYMVEYTHLAKNVIEELYLFMLCRSGVWKTLWAGIIVILDMDAGCQESM